MRVSENEVNNELFHSENQKYISIDINLSLQKLLQFPFLPCLLCILNSIDLILKLFYLFPTNTLAHSTHRVQWKLLFCDVFWESKFLVHHQMMMMKEKVNFCRE